MNYTTKRRAFFAAGLIIGFAAFTYVGGCTPDWVKDIRDGEHTSANVTMEEAKETWGELDTVTAHMPFASGYRSMCTQGTGQNYTHHYNSTYYDIDLDTPNDRNDEVYAPVSGVVRVHDNPSDPFGRHVNIDLGDGTYVNLSHLEEIFVDDNADVAAGQLLGYEGTTGESQGDHVHFGRHEGDASKTAGYGTSVMGLRVRTQESGENKLTRDFYCRIPNGGIYTSELDVSMWHPEGTLVKAPDAAKVYLVEDGKIRPFRDEESFWSRGYAFSELVLVSNEELACYGTGSEIVGTDMTEAVRDGDTVWLLIGLPDDPDRKRKRVGTVARFDVLESWGVRVYAAEDIPDYTEIGIDLASYPVEAGNVVFRNGALVKEADSSAVYVVADGIAMPIVDWDTYLLAGFWSRTVIFTDPGAVKAVQGRVGDCATNTYCLTAEDLVTCGGSDEGSFTAAGSQDDTGTDTELGTDTGLVDTDPDTGMVDNGSDSGDPADGGESRDTGLDTGLLDGTDTPAGEDTGDTGLAEEENPDEDVRDTDTGLPPDTAVVEEDPEPVTGELFVAWLADSIKDHVTMRGELIRADGSGYGWQTYYDVYNAAGAQAVFPDASTGDTFTFRVEYEDDGVFYQGCQPPYPPGIVRGDPSATFNGSSVPVSTAPVPDSIGCWFTVQVP